MKITSKTSDEWICVCGNMSCLDSFYPEDPTNEDPTKGLWVCIRCGVIIDAPTLEIVARLESRK